MTINPITLFDAIRFALLAIVIGYAALSDYRWGEVKNKVWAYAPFGLALTIPELSFTPQLLLPTFLSISATLIISLLLFYIGGWGGADAKAFLTIGACLPVAPFVQLDFLFMYPLTVILVSSVLAFVFGKILKTKTVRFLPYVFASLFIALLV